MNPLHDRLTGQYPPNREYRPPVLPIQEVCSEFLIVLSRSIKMAALYRLNHPMVIESLGRAASLLGRIFSEKKEPSLTLELEQDAWMFNDTRVPALSGEPQNLFPLFKAHGIQGLIFSSETRSFELGALCEFFGITQKNSPEGYFREFLLQRGVRNIRQVAIHRGKESRYVDFRDERAPGPGYRPAPGTRNAAAEASFAASPVKPEPSKAAWPIPDTAPARTDIPKAVAAPVPAPGVNGSPKSAAPAAALHGTAGGPGPSILSSVNFGSLVTKLVESVVKDPNGRLSTYNEALGLIREAMHKQVAETTKPLLVEKEHLLNTRTRTENVLNTMAEGKFIVDKEGRILMMNPAAEEISGKRFADIAGRHISENLNPEKHFLALSGDMDLSNNAKLTGRVNLSGDNNVGQAMRRSMALLEDDEGRVVGAYTTLPDVAKFKETQRMQEEFLSRITHDLQSPLSSISSALEMLTESAGAKLDPTENNFLDISIRNSHRLVEMIRGILDFSKLQSGKMDVHIKPSPLGPILKEAGESLLPWAKTKGVNLVVSPPAREITVMADHGRIVQVLANLMSNALKATPKGGTVIVAASPAPEDEPAITIGVRDTGHGIPKEDLDKLFKKFVQINTYERQEGVGLGLSIVSEFIKLHSGKVWADSEPGKGSTFYFTLPVAPDGGSR